MKYDYIEDRLIKLKKKIENVCKTSGRNAGEIHLIAVSKTFPAEAIVSAIDFNQLDFGENKVQELVMKHSQLKGRIVNWHLIGHLQTNKVKYIVPFIYLIHSLDSYKLAVKTNSEAAKLGKVVKCLIQVNTSGEEQKSGCAVSEALKLVKEISVLDNIRIKGFMTISKMISEEDEEAGRTIVRENFRTLKNLFDEARTMKIPNVDMKYLSMGMTQDYDIAIEEGSNMLRIGSAIFGERETNK
jgi:pyridoxal phosphate enzyme (YggS family)